MILDRCRFVGVAFAVAVAAPWPFHPGSALAQHAAIPFADPQKFVEQLLGEPADAEREQLAGVEITAAEERQVGDAGARRLIEDLRRQSIAVTDRGRDVEYLQQLVEVLRPQMTNARRYPAIKVYVADAPLPDARSFPGGTRVFYRGLLDFTENEAALAGVVGHELSHLDRGHQLLWLRRSKAMEGAFSAKQGFSPEQFIASASMMARAFAKPFRPEDEAEADADGAKWAYRAGYDPREMAKLFLAMHRREGKQGQRTMPTFLRQHPFHLDRQRAVQDLYDQLQLTEPKADLYIGRVNLQRRVARAEREFTE